MPIRPTVRGDVPIACRYLPLVGCSFVALVTNHLIGPVQEPQVLARYAENTAALVQISYRLTASSARLLTQLFTRLLTCIFAWFELAIGIPS